LSDVAHRVMTIEAATSQSWGFTGIAGRLKKQPVVIQQLSRFRQGIEEVVQFGIRVVPTEVSHVLLAARVSQQYGLLSGDALIVSVMQSHGLTHLASEDADFDRVPGITRYGPG
jgi:predicted nucleic acid-binding protein